MTRPRRLTAANIKRLAKEYRHAVWLLLLPLHLLLFFLAEKVIISDYWVSYSPLDDKIPFISAFIIPYCLWYPSLVVPGAYLLRYEPNGFRRYMWALFASFFFCVMFCLVFPNGQDLRPAVIDGSDVLGLAVQAMYEVDTNTNVLPSMHVVGALIAVIAVFDSPGMRRIWSCALSVIIAGLIIISTVLVKQHSVLDIFAGIGLVAVAYPVFYVVVKKRQPKGP